MDKVNGTQSQAVPVRDRQISSRGHYSSVDGALRAHRQRKVERENRTAERLNLVRNMQTQFFPTSNVMNRPDLMNDPIQSSGFKNQARVENQVQVQSQVPMQNQIQIPAQALKLEQPEMASFNPMEMDEIYAEASMGSIADNALGVVQKEIANPEEGPIDDMPKGSYVDYTV